MLFLNGKPYSDLVTRVMLNLDPSVPANEVNGECEEIGQHSEDDVDEEEEVVEIGGADNDEDGTTAGEDSTTQDSTPSPANIDLK